MSEHTSPTKTGKGGKAKGGKHAPKAAEKAGKKQSREAEQRHKWTPRVMRSYGVITHDRGTSGDSSARRGGLGP